VTIATLSGRVEHPVQSVYTHSLSNRKIQIGFASAMAILLVVAGLSYRSSVAASESDRWVQHTHEVLETLQGIALDERTIESSARGFIMTGDDSYLGDYHSSVLRMAQDQEAFGALTVDNPRQQDRLHDLARLALAKFQLAETITGLRRAKGFDATLDPTRKGGGQRLMNELLAVVDGARKEELRLLTIRNEVAQRYSRQAKNQLILCTLLGLVITAVSGWSVQRENVRRERAEEVLFAEKERAQVTLDSIGDAVACTDIFGNLTFLNPVAEKLSGWSWREATGRPMPEVFRILDGESHEPIPNPMELSIVQDRNGHLPPNSILVRRDGFEIPIEVSVAPVHDRAGRAIGAVIAFRDVTLARAIAKQMTYAAEHDFLTGLPNRMRLNDRIDQAIAVAPRHMKRVAVLFVDLDGFKHINDSLGHPVGDKLLQSVAERLVDCVRASDTVSRQGGDEFVVLLSEVQHLEDAAVTAARMLTALAQAHCVDQHELHVTASIGVSVYPADGLDAVTLIKNADIAMYRAKVNGRQSYQFFKPIMNAVEQTFVSPAAI
jgi:diguanylate cyclase (GGDEF)-like protein/PAS domain S-box-containing protein